MKKDARRDLEHYQLTRLMKSNPVVAILGPRQCGKTTLAKLLVKKGHFFDLENPRDLSRLKTPQLALENLTGTIVIDEIQRLPELFPLLRYLVDQKLKQKFLILGSASRELIQQSSESLAGRIAYHELGGFSLDEILAKNLQKLWIRGGMPRSFLGRNNTESVTWRSNYITTYLEQDIPQLGIQIPSQTLRRFWTLLSHYHGQVVNLSAIGRDFGMSDKTVRHYLEILQGTFMVRLLHPWHVNVGKRLVKSPKIYFRDSGLLHSFLSVTTLVELESHPKLGASWEGFVVEQVCRVLRMKNVLPYFWSTHSGAEIDLFWQKGGKNYGLEIKYSDAPTLTSSMRSALTDLKLHHLWVCYPGKELYKLHEKATVSPLSKVLEVI